MRERMEGRRMVRLSTITLHLRNGEIEGDWATIGVLVSKSNPKTSQKVGPSGNRWLSRQSGKQYNYTLVFTVNILIKSARKLVTVEKSLIFHWGNSILLFCISVMLYRKDFSLIRFYAQLQGSQYSIWKLSDLSDCTKTAALFLFGGAHRALWKHSVGTVFGILNPNILKERWIYTFP